MLSPNSSWCREPQLCWASLSTWSQGGQGCPEPGLRLLTLETACWCPASPRQGGAPPRCPFGNFQEYSPGGGAGIWHPVERGEWESRAGLRGPGLLGHRINQRDSARLSLGRVRQPCCREGQRPRDPWSRWTEPSGGGRHQDWVGAEGPGSGSLGGLWRCWVG